MAQKKVIAAGLLIFFTLLAAKAIQQAMWEQVNISGFGNLQTNQVSALEMFGETLYAGTSNATDGARIFRWQDGETWIPVSDAGFGIPHDTAPPAILDLVVFNGRLYASTGRGDGPGQIWRAIDGKNWAPMVISGFGDPDTKDISALAVYKGLIYAGAGNQVNGAQIWRSYTGDSNTWTQVAPALEGAALARVTAFAEFEGALYAAVESDAPAQIWRSYGGDWTTVVSDGFGDGNTTITGGLATFGGNLYAAAGNETEGAQLWRSGDGENWEQVIEPGFGDANNEKAEIVLAFENALYVSVKNGATGMEVWRSANGLDWERVNDGGFGDVNNVGSNWNNAVAQHLHEVYVGTSNAVDGGELWRMAPAALYGVALSPDEYKAGLPGETVTYTVTITNTGNVTDTYGLTAAGTAWTTVLSTSSVLLAPGASSTFSVLVSVPPAASAGTVDVATVTATSESDPSLQDTALLTTSCFDPGEKTYLPVIRNSHS